MLLRLILISALAPIAFAQAALCADPTDLTIQYPHNATLCCSAPETQGDGITCTVADSEEQGLGEITCQIEPTSSASIIPSSLAAPYFINFELGGGPGNSQQMGDGALPKDSECFVNGCSGGRGSLLIRRNYKEANPGTTSYTFVVGTGASRGGGWTGINIDSVSAVAAGGGSASYYGPGSAGGDSVIAGYSGYTSGGIKTWTCDAPADPGFTSDNNISPDVYGADGGNGAGEGLFGSPGISCSCSLGSSICPEIATSGGGGGEDFFGTIDASTTTLGFTKVAAGSTRTTAYAKMSYVTTCTLVCGEGYMLTLGGSKCCLNVNGACGIVTPSQPAPSNQPSPSNSIDTNVTPSPSDVPASVPDSSDVPTVATPSSGPSSSTSTTSDPPASNPSSGSTPTGTTGAAPGAMITPTSTDSAATECFTCVDYAPPSITATKSSITAQGVSASNIVISSATSLSFSFALVWLSLPFLFGAI